MAKSNTQESSTMALLQNMKTERTENTKKEDKKKEDTAPKEAKNTTPEKEEVVVTKEKKVESVEAVEESTVSSTDEKSISEPEQTATFSIPLNIKPKEKRDVRKGFLFTKSINDAFADEAKKYGVKENELIIQILSARYNIQ